MGLLANLVTFYRTFEFGGQSSKRARWFNVTFPSTLQAIADIGSLANPIAASDLGLTKIEDASVLVVYTVATGAIVAVYETVASIDGQSVYTLQPTVNVGVAPFQIAGIALTNTQAARLRAIGY